MKVFATRISRTYRIQVDCFIVVLLSRYAQLDAMVLIRKRLCFMVFAFIDYAQRVKKMLIRRRTMNAYSVSSTYKRLFYSTSSHAKICFKKRYI